IPYNYTPKITVVSEPALNQTKEVAVGETPLTQKMKKRTMALHIVKSFVVGDITIPAGIYEMLGNDSEADYFADINTEKDYRSVLSASGNSDIVGFSVAKSSKNSVCILSNTKGKVCADNVNYQ